MGLPNSFEPELPLTSPPPAPPTEWLTLIHPLTIHVLDVVDRTVPFMEFRQEYEPDEDEDLTRRHDYSHFCFRGRVDGTRMGSTPRPGAHPFGGPGGFGIAGDWGGRRANGLLAPAKGVPPPLLTAARTVAATENLSTTSAARSRIRSTGLGVAAVVHSSLRPLAPSVVGSTALAPTSVQALASSKPASSGCASTVVGLAALVLTPTTPMTLTQALMTSTLMPSGCASTMEGSAAYGDTLAGQGTSDITAVG